MWENISVLAFSTRSFHIILILLFRGMEKRVTVVRLVLLGMVITALTACNDEGSEYEGVWKASGMGIESEIKISFDEIGGEKLMTVTTTQGGYAQSKTAPVVFKEDGVYAVTPLGEVKALEMLPNGNLIFGLIEVSR